MGENQLTSSQSCIILLVLSRESSVVLLALSWSASSSVRGGPSSCCCSAAMFQDVSGDRGVVGRKEWEVPLQMQFKTISKCKQETKK